MILPLTYFLLGLAVGLMLAFLLRIINLRLASGILAGLREERNLAEREQMHHQNHFSLHVQSLNQRVDQLASLMREIEKDRDTKYGALAQRLQVSNEQTSQLITATQKLRETLTSSQSRGHLGEKVAEDMMRLHGLIENVHYKKQQLIEGVGSRPDFSFLLPNGGILNMDVKFPMAKYLKFLEEPSENERTRLSREFLSDIKARVREISQRGYVNAEQQTLDFVLLFIPSESVFEFLMTEGEEILQFAQKSKVVCCSPFTLFPIIAMVRHLADVFNIERKSLEVMTQIRDLREQWEKFMERFEAFGGKIALLQKDYDQLFGTRRNQLEKAWSKIDQTHTNASTPPVKAVNISA